MLTLWRPFDELLRNDDFWGLARPEARVFNPAVDLVEEDKAFVLKAEMPGVKAEEVDVKLDGNVLTIRGERKYEQADAKAGYRRIERRFGTFQRAFSLPNTVAFADIEATLDAGILTVRVPKKESPQPRKVQVKSASDGPAR
jgi:HSP20 family protein